MTDRIDRGVAVYCGGSFDKLRMTAKMAGGRLRMTARIAESGMRKAGSGERCAEDGVRLAEY
ncbi:MAG: hypothetical protein U9M98_03745 [Patescibacteria group bacterium]|nr:hypothetical protein [Patescibacteria group bacterium]